MSDALNEGINIPERIQKLVYKMYVKEYGNKQSLERIRDRGGFGIQEIIDFLDKALESWTEVLRDYMKDPHNIDKNMDRIDQILEEILDGW
jgi:hypothetical protein